MVQKLSNDIKPRIYYPGSDSQPIADNTKQFRWIVTIRTGNGTDMVAAKGRRVRKD